MVVDTRRISDILLPIVSLVVIWSLVSRGGDSLWSGHLRTDCYTFQARGSEFLDGGSWEGLKNNEYQPGALWIFAFVEALGRAVGGRFDFLTALVGLNVALLGAHIGLARWLCGQAHGWAMVALVGGMGPILLYRFEPAVSLLVILSVLCSRGALFPGTAVAGSLLGAAIATKLYPLILVPGLIFYSLKKWGWGGGAATLAGVGVGVGLPTLALLSFGATTPALTSAVGYHFDKPVGVDGFWGSAFPLLQWAFDEPLRMASRNAIHGFDPSLPGIPAAVLQAVTWIWLPVCGALILGTLLLRRGNFAHGPGAVFAIMGAYVAFSKLSTPQYIWWALPIIAFVPKRWFTSSEKFALFTMLSGCLTLGQLVFPLHYSEFLAAFHKGEHLESWLFWINAAKNFLWAGVVVIGIRALLRNLLSGRQQGLSFWKARYKIPKTMNNISVSSSSAALAVLFAALLTGCNPPPPAPAAKSQEPVTGEAGQTGQLDRAGESEAAAAGGEVAGKEKFAAVRVIRNASNSRDAEAFIKNFDGSVDVKLGPEQANDHQDESGTCAAWIFHSPLDNVVRADGENFPDIKQFSVDGDGVYLWAKTQHRGVPGFKTAVYYRTDGKEPFGSRGKGEDGTQSATLEYSHNSPSDQDGSDAWWRVGPLPAAQGEDSFTYKIGVWRE